MVKDQKVELTDALARAVEGLLYISEADYPFEVFSSSDKTDSLTPQSIRKITHHGPKTPVESVNLKSFFRALTEEQQWYGPAERKTAAQYKSLLKILQDNLHDLKVFKLGKTQVDIYIVGISSTGEVIGVSTRAVET
jgi:hypothetical protein